MCVYINKSTKIIHNSTTRWCFLLVSHGLFDELNLPAMSFACHFLLESRPVGISELLRSKKKYWFGAQHEYNYRYQSTLHRITTCTSRLQWSSSMSNFMMHNPVWVIVGPVWVIRYKSVFSNSSSHFQSQFRVSWTEGLSPLQIRILKVQIFWLWWFFNLILLIKMYRIPSVLHCNYKMYCFLSIPGRT